VALGVEYAKQLTYYLLLENVCKPQNYSLADLAVYGPLNNFPSIFTLPVALEINSDCFSE
jgi:hypothetical protein